MTVRATKMTTPKKTTTANLCPVAKLASPKTTSQMMPHKSGTLILSACVDGAANGCSCASDDRTAFGCWLLLRAAGCWLATTFLPASMELLLAASPRAAGCFSAADSDTPCGTTGVRAACTSAAPCTAQLSMGSQDEVVDAAAMAARMHGTSHREKNILKKQWNAISALTHK